MSQYQNAEATEAPQKRRKLFSVQVTDLNREVDGCYEEVADSNSVYDWPTDQDILNYFLDPEYSLQDQQDFTLGVAASSSTPVGQSFTDCLSFDILEVCTLL